MTIVKAIAFFWVSLSIVIGLYITLIKDRTDLAYKQVFLWFICPVTIFAGILFLDKARKKRYFERVKAHLFIKE